MQQNQKLVKISRKSLIVDVISSCLAISSLFIPLFSFGGLDSENLFKFLTDFFKGLSGNGVLTRWHFVFMLTALLIFIGAMMSFIDLFRMLVKSGKAPAAPKLNSTAHFIFALIAFIVCVVYVLTRDKLTIALLLQLAEVEHGQQHEGEPHERHKAQEHHAEYQENNANARRTCCSAVFTLLYAEAATASEPRELHVLLSGG